MKKITSLFILLFYGLAPATAQNSVEHFYNEKNKAITEFALKRDSAKLVSFYTRCLSKYSNVMLNDIDYDGSDGLEYAVLIYDYKSADQLFKYEIATGLTEAMFPSMRTKPHFAKYFATPEAQQIVKDYQTYNNIYKQGVHLPYYSIISSYSNMDQYARSLFGNDYSWVTGDAYKRFDYLDNSTKEKIFKNMVDVTDSLTFAALYDAVDRYGFFTSSKTRGGLGFLLVHLYGPGRDQIHQGVSSTAFLDSLMLKAVKEGEFSPYEYIFMHDVPEYPYSFTTKSTYGCSIRGQNGNYYIPNEIIDIKNIDKRRASIYLPPLWVDALLFGFELPKGYKKS